MAIGIVASRLDQPQIVLEILLVERGDYLARLDRVSFVDGQRGDPAIDLEGQIHLPHVDVALHHQLRVIAERDARMRYQA